MIHIILSASLFKKRLILRSASVKTYCLETLTDAQWVTIHTALAKGDDLIVLGVPPQEQLRRFWLKATRPVAATPDICPHAEAPCLLPDLQSTPAACWGLSWQPDKEFIYHNIDEELRAELVPLYEAVDRFGQPVAYPAVMIRHTAPSLVTNKFAYGRWLFFAWDDPGAVFTKAQWQELLTALLAYLNGGVQLTKFITTFASYAPKEPVGIFAKLFNATDQIQSALVRAEAIGPSGAVRTITIKRWHLNPREELAIQLDWTAPATAGLWQIRVRLYREDIAAWGEARETTAQYIESAQCGIVITDGAWPASAQLRVELDSLTINDQSGFYTGTHYYPSNCWWDWLWRDFRPVAVARDFAAMRAQGLRWVRLWIDPELDETSLRAMDAALYLCSVYGLVPIITVFTQWARYLSYTNERGDWVHFQFMGWRDFNVYSVSLTDMNLQEEYIGVLARRWGKVPNLVWNLANESYLVAPDAGQMDNEFANLPHLPESEPARSQALFRAWAARLISALRQDGAEQPVMAGYIFPQAGDTYLENSDSQIVPWHDYNAPATIAWHLLCTEPASRKQPLVLEEFGVSTLDDATRARWYEETLYQALAGHANLACSYEWGISHLAPALPLIPTPLRDCAHFDPPDPRWFGAVIPAAQEWPDKAAGLAPWAAGFNYGMIYAGTAFPQPALRMMNHFALLADCAGYHPKAHRVYVMLPMEFADRTPGQGWPRKLDRAQQLIEALWQRGIIFGVWQEDQWETLPRCAQAVIFPCEESNRPEAQRLLAALQARGVAVYVGADSSWQQSTQLSQVRVSADLPVQVMTRDTQDGTLYILCAENNTPITVHIDNHQIDMELARFGLIMIENDRIRLIEGRGDIRIDGDRLARIEGSRVLMKAKAGEELRTANEILLSAVDATTIDFPRPLTGLNAILDITNPAPREFSLSSDPGGTLTINPELSTYVIRAHFSMSE
jgi:hypothetical protein